MDKNFKQSTLARKFLRWYEHSRNVTLRTSDSPQYEKKIAQYWVDGFIDRANRPIGSQEKDLVVEVHGCYWLVLVLVVILHNKCKVILYNKCKVYYITYVK
jgi:hypothetical protein